MSIIKDFAADLARLIGRAETAGATGTIRDRTLWTQVRELLTQAAALVATIGSPGA